MPLGGMGSIQELIKLTQTEHGTLREESLGDVMFVPLISDP
jgi:hypothetical protein